MDFNNVKIISYSKMNTDLDLDLGEQVAYFARVSNPKNQSNIQSSQKLCNYLLSNKHFSPFEMVNICIEVKTTRDISRQLLRHRSFSFQEFSQRYAVVDEEFVFRETRFQDLKNRQNSLELDETNDSESTVSKRFLEMQEELINKEKEIYNFCIENNIAKEVSRTILSEGLCPTTLYVNGNLRSWIHYIQARCDKTAQKEHRDLALKIKEEISKIFPLINNIQF